MEGVDSMVQSVWEDSQIMPENSIRLAENVEGFQQCVKEILNLIEQDGNLSELTAEKYNSKKSKLTTLVTELSRMHGVLADQHVHFIGEISKNLSSHLKDQQHVDSSDSTSPQVTQMFTPDQKSAHKFMTPIGFDVLLSSRTEGSESSFSLSSDSESESSMSTNKLQISPPNDDTSKVKEPKVQDLLKKISVVEEELLSLNTKIQTLTDENTKLKHDIRENESDMDSQNARIESEKAKVVELQEQVSDLKLVILESNLKIETMGDELEATTNELEAATDDLESASDEISDLKKELSSKIVELGTTHEEMTLLQNHINSQKAKILELQEDVNLYVSNISERDEEITELCTEINQLISEISLLKTTHSAKEESLNADIRTSKTEVIEKCKLIDDLNHKHDAVMSERDGVKAELDTVRAEMCHQDNLIRELETRLGSLQAEHARVVSSFDTAQKITTEVKLKVVELEKEVERQREVMSDRAEEKREAIRQLSFSLDHYMSGYKELREAFAGNRRRAVLTSS